MKAELLERLSCPRCRANSWSLASSDEDEQDVRTGCLTCLQCDSEFEITGGILDLLGEVGRGIAAEVEGWVEMAANEGWLHPPNEYLLELPRPSQPIPGDKINWDIHADNFDLILDQLSLDGVSVLDIGAGRCWSTKWLTLRGATCVAMDVLAHSGIGLGAGDVLMRREMIYFDRVLGDMTDIPFTDSSFDLVFFTGALHPSTDLSATVSEVHRIIRPGGKMAVTNEACGAFFSQEIKYDQVGRSLIHEHNYRYGTYLRAINDAGFSRHEAIPDTAYRLGSARSWRYRWINGLFSRLPGRRLPFLLKQYLFGGTLLIIAEKKSGD